MKTLYKLFSLTATLTLALLFSASPDATAHTPLVTLQQELVVNGGGEDSKGSSDVKAEKTKSLKPKKVKQYRTNHGPRKPIYPQLHRKKEKLSRARYLNAQR